MSTEPPTDATVVDVSVDKTGDVGFVSAGVSKSGDAPAGADDAAPATPAAQTAPLLSLFRYAQPLDIGLLVAAVICAIGHGVVMPLFSLLFGRIIVSEYPRPLLAHARECGP